MTGIVCRYSLIVHTMKLDDETVLWCFILLQVELLVEFSLCQSVFCSSNGASVK